MLFFPQRGSNFKGAAVNHGPLTWVDQNGLGRLMGAQSAGDSLMRIQKNRQPCGLIGVPVLENVSAVSVCQDDMPDKQSILAILLLKRQE